MQSEILYDNPDAFITALRGCGITRIAFSETFEKRAEQVEPGKLQVVSVNRVELIAYRDSTIHKCVLLDQDRDALYDRLTGEGFEVTRRSRNIT
jgi:hypothetical protein